MKHRKHIKSYPIRDLKVYLSKAKSKKKKKSTLASPQQQWMWTFAAIPSSSAGNRGSQESIKKRHKWLSWTVSYDNVGSRKVGKACYGQSQKYSPRI